jgi:PST family polysaccharide transporter
MGGASAVVMATGLLRGKLVALVLGPAGIGMMGVLNQLNASLTQVLGFGLGSSAVKYIAAGEADERADREATACAFSVKLAAYATVISLVLALPVCLATFGSFEHLALIICAGLTVPLAIISMTLGALLQARGPVSVIAKVQVYSALSAFLVGVPLVWLGGLWGLVGALAATTVAPLVFFPLFIRIKFPGFRAALGPIPGISSLVRMGFALIGTIIIAQLSAYLTRIAVVHHLGLAQAGYYQAAFSITGNIPAFVFAAMSADFYPRVAAAKNEVEALEATERQIKAGVLLATPCFVGLILFSPHLLRILYSDQFMEALGLLRWMTWGVACRLVSWPLGYWLLARATPKELFWLEGIGAILVMVFTFVLVPWLGLMGAGVAFVLGAVVYGLALVIFLRRRSGRGLSSGCLLWFGSAVLSLAFAQMVTAQGWGFGGLSIAFVAISVPSVCGGYFAMRKEPHA